eukprot:5490843-Pleurochrysis_carterae.AAC.1
MESMDAPFNCKTYIYHECPFEAQDAVAVTGFDARKTLAMFQRIKSFLQQRCIQMPHIQDTILIRASFDNCLNVQRAIVVLGMYVASYPHTTPP